MAASDGTVEIRITGSVDSSLQASTATARAEVGSLATDTGAAAKQLELFSAYTGDASAQLNLFGTSAAQMTPAVTAVTAAEKAETAATIASTAAHTNARAVTESLASVHEIMQQRYSRLGGTLMILAQATTGASTSMLLMGAAAAGAVLGLGYLEYEALRAQKALDDLTEGFALTGRGAQMNADAVRYEVQFLSELPGVSTKVAESFVRLVAQHADWNTELSNSVGQLLPAFVRLYGDEAPQAAGKLVGALSDLTEDGFKKLDRELLGLNPTEYETIQHLIETGNTAEAVSRILADLSHNSGTYIKSLGDQVYDIQQKMQAVRNSMPAGSALNYGVDPRIAELQALQKQLDAVRAKEAQQGKTGTDTQYKNELDSAKEINAKLNERGQILQRISQLERDEGQAKSRGDKGGQTQFASAVAAEQAKLAELDKKNAEQGYRAFADAENAKAEAFKAGSAKRIQIAQDEYNKAVALFGAESTEASQALGHLNEERRTQSGGSGFSNAGAEMIAQARETVSEINADQSKGDAERAAEVQSVYARLLASGKLNAAQLIEVEREKNQAIVQSSRQADEQIAEFSRASLAQQVEIAKSDADTSIAISKMDIEAKKDALQEEVDSGRISKAAMLAQTRDLVAQEDQLDIDAVADANRNSDLSLAQHREYTNQIRELEEKKALDIASYNRQIADGENKLAQQRLRTWEEANREIISSENQFIGGIFQGRQTLGQLLEGLARNLVQKELEADIDYYTEKELIALEGNTKIQAVEKGGVLMDLLFNQTKTVQQTAGQTAQTAAVATGVASRNTTEATGQAAGESIQAAAAASQIAMDAAVAGAGAYAATAMIPYIGPVIAPAAATQAYTATLAFEGGIAAASGEYMVQGNDVPYRLHDREAVMPRSIADPMREFFEGPGSDNGNSYSRGGDTNHFHINNGVNFESLMHDFSARRSFTREMTNVMRNAGRRVR